MAKARNGVRTTSSIAKLAGKLLAKSKSAKVKKLAGSALSNRRK